MLIDRNLKSERGKIVAVDEQLKANMNFCQVNSESSEEKKCVNQEVGKMITQDAYINR